MRGVSGDDPAGGAGSGVARAGRRGFEKPGAVARHEQWLAASGLLAGSAERVRSGSWADNATVERREAGSRFCAGRPTPRKRGVAPYERDN